MTSRIIRSTRPVTARTAARRTAVLREAVLAAVPGGASIDPGDFDRVAAYWAGRADDQSERVIIAGDCRFGGAQCVAPSHMRGVSQDVDELDSYATWGEFFAKSEYAENFRTYWDDPDNEDYASVDERFPADAPFDRGEFDMWAMDHVWSAYDEIEDSFMSPLPSAVLKAFTGTDGRGEGDGPSIEPDDMGELGHVLGDRGILLVIDPSTVSAVIVRDGCGSDTIDAYATLEGLLWALPRIRDAEPTRIPKLEPSQGQLRRNPPAPPQPPRPVDQDEQAILSGFASGVGGFYKK